MSDRQTPASGVPRHMSEGPHRERLCRSDEELAHHEAAIVTAMALHLTEHQHIVLSYSGGAESSLLLHLFQPFRERFTVAWNNPGALPHEAEHVRRQAAGGPFVEIPSDREAFWREHGLPSHLVPAAAIRLSAHDTPTEDPPMVPFQLCCAALRWKPIDEWAAAAGVTLRIHGQRRGEGSSLFLPAPRTHSLWGPLAAWTREEVMRRVAHHGIPLPRQFAEGYPTSFECGVCPANLDPARMAFLRRHYPAEHAEAVRLAGAVMRQVSAAYEWQRVTMEGIPRSPRDADASVGSQRRPEVISDEQADTLPA